MSADAKPTLLMRLALRQQARQGSSRRRLAVVGVGVTAAAVAIGGTAFAFWTSTGSGSGSALVAHAQLVSVAGGSNNALSLYPGANADIAVQVTNPNPYPVTITGVTAGDPANITGSGACAGTATGVTFKWTTKTGLSVNVAANGGVANLLITGTGSPNSGAITMSNSSDPACGTTNGLTLGIPVTVVAQSTTGTFSTPASATVSVP